MLKTKKILSVLFSLVMMFCTFSVAAFAESNTVSAISIDVDIEAGMTPNDIAEYVTINSEGLEFDDDDSNTPVSVYFSDSGDWLSQEVAFENDIAYDIYFYFKVSEGYEFDDSIKYVTINGKKTDNFYFYDSEDFRVITIYLYAFIINAEPYTDAMIEKAEITVDTNIAGTYINDYESYIDILTKELQFEDNYGDLAVYVYDENGDRVVKQFKSGETYTLYVYLAPKDGKVLADYVEGYINGEEISVYTNYWYPGEDYGDIKVDYVEFNFELTVDGEKQFTIFERIINFFRNLFDKFLDFFRIHPMPVK